MTTDPDLTERVAALESKVASMEMSIHNNIALTTSIKDDTVELIALFKGGKLTVISKWVKV